MMGRLEQGLGILLVLIILLDIFLTVLYARINTSIIGSWVARLVWELALPAYGAGRVDTTRELTRLFESLAGAMFDRARLFGNDD